MRHTASDIHELKHWFANQFVLVFDRTTTDMPSVIDVRRNENITSEGKCGILRYEPMTQWAWEQHELYTPESLRPSVLFSYSTPIAVIFPTQRVLLTTTQDSLLAGGLLGRAGIQPAGLRFQAFSSVWLHILPPEQALLGARQIHHQ